jgi:hypothetical protein
MSGYVRSQKFCCCLPVRFGVFVLSLVAMVGGSFVAAIGWIQVAQFGTHPREQWEEIALWIHSSMFSLLGLLAILGFLGCLIKSRGMVSSFAIGLAIHLGFSLASGIFTLYTLFKQSPQETIDKCVNGSEDQAVIEACGNGIGLMKGIMVAVYIITWLIQIYAYFVVERYVDQLDDEMMAKHTVVIPRSMTAADISDPQPTTYNGYRSAPYAFTTPRNAHGVGSGEDPSNRV